MVETLVAVSILSISVLATFTAVQGGLQSSLYVKDRITAFYLAQEAFEYIKNIRDDNIIKTISGTPTNWLAGLTANPGDPCPFTQYCKIDVKNRNVTNCGASLNNCPVLKQDTVSGLYNYTTGSDTTFNRGIQFYFVTSDEIDVAVTVQWITRGVTKSFKVQQSFFNR